MRRTSRGSSTASRHAVSSPVGARRATGASRPFCDTGRARNAGTGAREHARLLRPRSRPSCGRQASAARHPPPRGCPLSDDAADGPQARHVHPRRRHRPRGRRRRAPHHRGHRRRARLGGAPTPARACSRRARHRRPRGDDRVDPQDARRAQGPARDAGRLRREERQRHAAQAVRDLRQHPPRARAARRRRRRTRAASIDLVVVRENVEDLYAGIEHMQTPGVAAVPQAHLAQGLREDRAPRVRVRARGGPKDASTARRSRTS